MRYVIVALICAALALPACKTLSGAEAEGNAADEMDTAHKVGHLEEKVEGLKRKKEETEKRVKSLEQEAKKPDAAPPAPPAPPSP